MVLYDCMPSMSQFLSVDKLLLNDSVSQLGIVRNPTTPLCSDTTKREDFLTKKGPWKIFKNPKAFHACKDYESTYNVDILNSFNPELQLKSQLLNPQLKIN